jgi:hypothetical protein
MDEDLEIVMAKLNGTAKVKSDGILRWDGSDLYIIEELTMPGKKPKKVEKKVTKEIADHLRTIFR